MATLDLWLEGDWGGGDEHVVWHVVDVPFDLHRYHYDQRYAEIVSSYVKRALEHLGREVAELAMIVPEDYEQIKTDNCD